MACRVAESRVVPAAVNVVWEKVRALDMSTWLDSVSSVQLTGGAGEVGSLRKVTFKDGTVQTFQILELSDLHHSVTYDVIESNPAITVLSAVNTLSLKAITHDNSTLVEWRTDFSHDATQEVIQDSKFKKIDGLASLIKSLKL